jgi:hypothetical protein
MHPAEMFQLQHMHEVAAQQQAAREQQEAAFLLLLASIDSQVVVPTRQALMTTVPTELQP